MPFGLSNSPAIFQEPMSVVLMGCDIFGIAYLDNIMVFSETLEEHLQRLNLIFGKLRIYKLKLKHKKCSFLKSETNYLGLLTDVKMVSNQMKRKSMQLGHCLSQLVLERSGHLSVCVLTMGDSFQTSVKYLNQSLL